MDANDPAYGSKEQELEEAKDATEDLRDTRNEKQEALTPVLVAQGMDEYYKASGLEFVAYGNWKRASDNLELAEQGLNEVNEDKPELEATLEEAKYELDRANNRQEYEERRAIYDEAKTRMDNLNEKERIAQESYDELSGDIQNLLGEYEAKTEQREHWA